MGEELMALRLALRPIADVMDPDDPERTRDADQHADINQKPFDRLWADECPMDHHPVHAHAVSDQQRRIGRDGEQCERVPCEK